MLISYHADLEAHWNYAEGHGINTMARNPIQFQSGLSLPAFPKQYDTEALPGGFQHRWPSGSCALTVATLPTVVQTNENGHPLRVQWRRVGGFTRAELYRYAQLTITPGSQRWPRQGRSNLDGAPNY